MPEQVAGVQEQDFQDGIDETDTDAANQSILLATEVADQPRGRLARLLAGDAGDPTPGVGWLTAAGLAEGGLLADVGIVLDLTSIYLPVIGTILSFAVPTPFAILMLRRGPRVTLLAATVSAFLITVLSGPHFGWRMGLEATLGLLLGWAMRSRMRPGVAFLGGTVLVAAVTFVAALGVIFLAGLPIADVVGELRNALGAGAWVVATGATLLGFQSQWLTIRPTLVALGLGGLHVWPLLLFFSLTASALPVVASYYALANATARVLGYEVRPFPSHGFMRLLRLTVLIITAPLALPIHGLYWLFHIGRRRPSPKDEADLEQLDRFVSSDTTRKKGA